MTYSKRKTGVYILLALVAAALAALALFAVTSSRGSTSAESEYAATVTKSDGTKLGDYADFSAAWTAANGEQDSTLKMLKDFTTASGLTVSAGAKFTLDLNDKKLAYDNASTTSSVITVNGEFTLTDGAATKTEKQIGGDANKTVIGGYITGGTADINGFGGGVHIGANAKFNMNGGVIAGNDAFFYGSGVFVKGGGLFNMTGGEISYNTVSGTMGGGGAVTVIDEATAVIEGGMICENKNANQCHGGGIYIGSSFNPATKGNVTVKGTAVIENNNGYGSGGGIYVQNGALEVGGNARIVGNKANCGGGIYVGAGCSLTLKGNAVISQNETPSNIGGIYSHEVITISGTPTVKDNISSIEGKNLYVSGGSSRTHLLKVDGPLKDGEKFADISIYPSILNLTSGFAANNSDIAPTEVFSFDAPTHCSALNNGEAYIYAHSLNPATYEHNETECWQVCNRKGCAYITNSAAHTFDENYTEDVAADCTNAGSQSRHCSRCDAKTDITVIDALGHDYAAEFTVDAAATCTEAGSKSKHCSRCEVKSEVTAIPAIGHSYGEWTLYRAATVEEFGEERRVCANDGTHYESRQLPKRVPQLVEMGGGEEAEVIVSRPEGLAPDVELVVTEIKSEDENYGTYSAIAESVNGKVDIVYDVTLKSHGVAVQPDGTITVKLRIPENLVEKTFKLFRVHGGEAVETEYTVDGKYAVVTTDKLSEFVFVGDTESNAVWIAFIVILSVIIAGEVAYIVYRKLRSKKEGK